jgi:hypothetical protein
VPLPPRMPLVHIQVDHNKPREYWPSVVAVYEFSNENSIGQFVYLFTGVEIQ